MLCLIKLEILLDSLVVLCILNPSTDMVSVRSLTGAVPRKESRGMSRSGVFTFDVDDEDFGKSSWSKNNPKTCVMVAAKPEGVAVRDSKDGNKTTLFFSHEEWRAFIAGVKGGEFN